MTERQRVLEICEFLALPPDQYVINGSGSLVMQGVPRPRPMADLDIFCTTALWLSLQGEPGWEVNCPDPTNPAERCDPPGLTRVVKGLRVDVFFDCSRQKLGMFDPALCLLNAVRVERVPCVALLFILDWKKQVGRAKDVEDVRVLEEFLRRSAA